VSTSDVVARADPEPNSAYGADLEHPWGSSGEVLDPWKPIGTAGDFPRTSPNGSPSGSSGALPVSLRYRFSSEAVAQSSEDEVRRPAWGLTYA
jgi:hypothetical protein